MLEGKVQRTEFPTVVCSRWKLCFAQKTGTKEVIILKHLFESGEHCFRLVFFAPALVDFLGLQENLQIDDSLESIGGSPRDLTSPSHASVLVNPDIGHVFFLHGLMERVGRGTYKIVRQCMEWGMAGPEWRQVNGGVRLTLFAPGKGSSAELNDRQKRLLADMAIGEPFRLQEYVDQFGGGITDRQARRDLSQLELMGLIRRLGSGSKTAYEVAEK